MGRRRSIVAVAVAAIAIDTALLGLIAPLLPEIEERTGASEGALGASLSVYALPVVVLSLALGRAADAFGRRPLLIGGLVLTRGRLGADRGVRLARRADGRARRPGDWLSGSRSGSGVSESQASWGACGRW